MIIEHCKLSRLLNDSTVSKCVTKKWVEVNNLSSSQYSDNKKYKVENFKFNFNC